MYIDADVIIKAGAVLAGPVIVGFDWLDYWLCCGERPKYRII